MMLCLLVPLLLAAPLVIHEKSWESIDVLERSYPAHLATHHSAIPRRHFSLDLGYLLVHATTFLVLMSPRSPFHFFLLLEFPCLSQFPAMRFRRGW